MTWIAHITEHVVLLALMWWLARPSVPAKAPGTPKPRGDKRKARALIDAVEPITSKALSDLQRR